jgi:hypothetical protein
VTRGSSLARVELTGKIRDSDLDCGAQKELYGLKSESVSLAIKANFAKLKPSRHRPIKAMVNSFRKK